MANPFFKIQRTKTKPENPVFVVELALLCHRRHFHTTTEYRKYHKKETTMLTGEKIKRGAASSPETKILKKGASHGRT